MQTHRIPAPTASAILQPDFTDDDPTGTRMIEFACAENNRNPVDAAGRTLTLDQDGNILDDL